MKKFGILILVLALGLCGLTYSLFKFAVTPHEIAVKSDENAPPPRTIVLEVTRADRVATIAQKLENQGIISSAFYFKIVARVLQKGAKFKAGEYEISAKQTPLEMMSVIESGISMGRPLTIAEGKNMYEVAAEIGSKGFSSREQVLALLKNENYVTQTLISLGIDPRGFGLRHAKATFEGFLFPDTYLFSKNTPAEEIIKRMVKRFKSEWTAREDARAAEIGLNPYQVLTLASMIEKETGAPEERPMISSVFHNRLKKKMRLQSDPTTIYGIWETFSGNITKAHLLEVTPFNTYAIPALPQGPISNPGREAIQAALYPAESEYLFFVSHNDGTHEFTKTFNDHQSAVKKFQLDPKAREGKSWRNRTSPMIKR